MEGLPEFLTQVIADDRQDILKETFSVIPLDTLDIDLADNLLADLLLTATDNNRDKCLKMIYDAFSATQTDNNKFSLMAYMLTDELFSDKALSYTLLKLNFTFVDLFDQLLDRGDSQVTSNGIVRLIRLFDAESWPDIYEILMMCYGKTEKSEIVPTYIQETLQEYIEKYSPEAEIPKYMIPIEGEECVLVENADEQVDVDKLPNDIIIDELINDLEDDIIEIDGNDNHNEQKQILKKMLKDATPEEREKIVAPLRIQEKHRRLFDDKALFRKYGPSHPTYNTTLDEDTPCGSYGGCRMFLCICHETTDEDLDNIERGYMLLDNVSWFTGKCKSCKLTIKKMSRAVRKILIDGGWIGCYCSIKCVKQDIFRERTPEEFIPENDDEIDKEDRPDIIPLVDEIEAYLINIGIFDE